MESNLPDYILHVCAVLHKREIEYIIVGGAAVALHGHFRKSFGPDGKPADKPDLDIWYNPTYENYFKLLDAIEELGQDVEDFRSEQAPNPKKSFFKFEFADFTLDFLPSLGSNLSFSASFKNCDIFSSKGIDISFINLSDLIMDKKANARAKDLEDIEHLKNKRR